MLRSRFAVKIPKVIKRSFGTNIPVLQKATDPIQQLFLDKIREYVSKNKDGKLFEASPEMIQSRKSELEKLIAQYGKEDMTKFPEFKFTDPAVDINNVNKK